jgi:hypothetical protein
VFKRVERLQVTLHLCRWTRLRPGNSIASLFWFTLLDKKIDIMRKYLLPISLGFVGMVVAHIIILLGFGLGIKSPLYFIAYPIVYALIALLLTRRSPDWWLSNVICICLIPFIYWYPLLWIDGKFHSANAMDFRDSSGILLILPFTLIASAFISFNEFKHKKLTEAAANKSIANSGTER